MDGNTLSIFGRQGRSRDTCVGTFARQWKWLSRSCPDVFLNMPEVNMPPVCHATEVEYVCRMREVFFADVLFDSDMVD